jgi:thiamine pyrophosphate-dependent acetolactate synthase large subunit-like protein
VTRAAAVALALSLLRDDDIVVAADGAISREAYRAHDRLRTFYMLSSMGQVASIALGLAMSRRERVVALDGDGNLLMGFGNLALVGGLKPANLYHLVLDNGCYATTGGQPALSRQVDLAAAAGGAGYAWARRCGAGDDALAAVRAWLAAPSPAFLDLAVSPDDPDPAPRIPMTPEQMAGRIRTALAGRNAASETR